ncbi:MAG: hypothetical protein ACTSRS_10480 [Candidatus Helarchaeota archaeon]
MRKRPRSGIKFSSLLKIGLVLLPFLLGGLYIGGALYIIGDITTPFLQKNYDSGEFIPANFTLMAQWADAIELRFEQYHIPANISLKVTFTDSNYDTPSYYHPTDNVALSTGMALATECFRYRAAVRENNTALKTNATRVIKKLLTGFSYLLAVPNGGIGPEYPGTISRFYWAPDNTAIPGYASITNWMLDENEVRHFNGTGAYKNYRWRGYTSKDEMAGYLFGLGAAIQFCQDEPWIWNRTRLLIAQIIEGYLKTNWLVINGDGNPCGSDMKSIMFMTGGEWILSLLRIGKTAFPDGRYDQLYHYFASKDMYMNSVARADPLNLIMDYYAWNFNHKTIFNLITLEDNPQLKNFYISQYINGIYNKIRYTRSPYFNMMYLVFTGENNDEIKKDIFDQLMRFENNTLCRNVNATARPSSHQLNPRIQYWRDFIGTNPIGMLYSPLTLEVGALTAEGKNYYLQPATVDMMYHNVGNFYEKNPFEEISGYNSPSNNGLTEGPGNTFTVVYWMGRAYGIIPPP